jgi:hypothetical protein
LFRGHLYNSLPLQFRQVLLVFTGADGRAVSIRDNNNSDNNADIRVRSSFLASYHLMFLIICFSLSFHYYLWLFS